MNARGLYPLGRALARTGLLAKLAFGVGLLTVFGTAVLAFAAARSAEPEALEAIPLVASNLLAWGAGVLLAFGVSGQALVLDRNEGIVHLYRARGASLSAYLWARISGLAVALAWLCAGGTLVCGLLAALLGRGGGVASRALVATAAGVAFSLAFAVVLAPVAFAALGTRKRVGGYIALVAVLGVPELVAPWTAKMLPSGWGHLASIPGALMSVRSALSADGADLSLLLRAVAVLALIVALALLLVRAELAGLDLADIRPSSAAGGRP